MLHTPISSLSKRELSPHLFLGNKAVHHNEPCVITVHKKCEIPPLTLHTGALMYPTAQSPYFFP